MFTEEQLQQLKSLITEVVNPALTTLKTEIQADVNTRNSGLAASINRDVKKLLEGIQPVGEGSNDINGNNAANNSKDGNNSDQGQGRLTLAALQSEMTKLKSELTEERKLRSERDSRLIENQLGQVISGLSTDNKVRPELSKSARDLFLFRHSGKIKHEGSIDQPESLKWFVDFGDENVKPLDEVFTSFLGTDEGKNFIGVNSPAPGSGQKEPPRQVTFGTQTRQEQTAPKSFGQIAAAELVKS